MKQDITGRYGLDICAFLINLIKLLSWSSSLKWRNIPSIRPGLFSCSKSGKSYLLIGLGAFFILRWDFSLISATANLNSQLLQHFEVPVTHCFLTIVSHELVGFVLAIASDM